MLIQSLFDTSSERGGGPWDLTARRGFDIFIAALVVIKFEVGEKNVIYLGRVWGLGWVEQLIFDGFQKAWLC